MSQKSLEFYCICRVAHGAEGDLEKFGTKISWDGPPVRDGDPRFMNVLNQKFLFISKLSLLEK